MFLPERKGQDEWFLRAEPDAQRSRALALVEDIYTADASSTGDCAQL
jgi:hypothetical protein